MPIHTEWANKTRKIPSRRPRRLFISGISSTRNEPTNEWMNTERDSRFISHFVGWCDAMLCCCWVAACLTGYCWMCSIVWELAFYFGTGTNFCAKVMKTKSALSISHSLPPSVAAIQMDLSFSSRKVTRLMMMNSRIHSSRTCQNWHAINSPRTLTHN